MAEIVLLVDRQPEVGSQEIDWHTASERISPLLQAQLNDSAVRIQVRAVEDLTVQEAEYLHSPEILLYSLTLNRATELNLPGQALMQRCQDLPQLYAQITQWGYAIGAGYYWLPIILTAKGPLYGEVIGRRQRDSVSLLAETPASPQQVGYVQPVHLSDTWRQPLYAFGFRLLRYLTATPGVYCLQFGWQEHRLCFERLWPFPIKAAIASLGVQTPDLFACHWLCLAGLPILDLQISGQASYQQFSTDIHSFI